MASRPHHPAIVVAMLLYAFDYRVYPWGTE
jgi:hypothetical protein